MSMSSNLHFVNVHAWVVNWKDAHCWKAVQLASWETAWGQTSIPQLSMYLLCTTLHTVIFTGAEGHERLQCNCTHTHMYPYSWIADQLDIGTSLGRRNNQVQFQIRDQFWIPQPRLHGACYLIFCETSKQALRVFCQCFYSSVEKVVSRGF